MVESARNITQGVPGHCDSLNTQHSLIYTIWNYTRSNVTPSFKAYVGLLIHTSDVNLVSMEDVPLKHQKHTSNVRNNVNLVEYGTCRKY